MESCEDILTLFIIYSLGAGSRSHRDRRRYGQHRVATEGVRRVQEGHASTRGAYQRPPSALPSTPTGEVHPTRESPGDLDGER